MNRPLQTIALRISRPLQTYLRMTPRKRPLLTEEDEKLHGEVLLFLNIMILAVLILSLKLFMTLIEYVKSVLLHSFNPFKLGKLEIHINAKYDQSYIIYFIN